MVKQPPIRRQASHSKSFREGISILTDEINLALQWQRPSILLTVHKSKLGQVKAQETLEREIVKKNIKVKRIKINSSNTDIISVLCRTPDRDRIVFFVSGIETAEKQKAGDVYRALNMHREFLVEQHVRVVFWLTELEAGNLPHHAPDFWAFRHRVVEFASRENPKKGPTP
ncbi:MAG: hypothetical protein HZB50_15695 [Chloroflexi bacterium]|nr:hypothetical protein [Chloroflexota bacterium]